MIFGKHVNKFYKRYWYMILIGIIALVVVDFFQLEIPVIIGNIVNGLERYIDDTIDIAPLTKEVLRSSLLMILGIAGIIFVGRFTWRVTIFNLGVHVESDLRDEMFVHSEKLSREYFQTHKVGEEMALYTHDLQAVRQAFGRGIMMVVDALFLGVYAFYRMFTLNPMLALVSCIPLVIIACMGSVIGKSMKKRYERVEEANAALTDFTQENFSGITVIKAFVKETKELLRFNVLSKKNCDRNIEFVRFSMLLWILFDLLINSVLLIIILYVGWAKAGSSNALNVGDLFKFIAYFDAIIWPMLAISQLINLRSQAKASMKRIGAMLDYPEDIKVDDPVDVTITGHIEYKGLTFKYPEAAINALEDINLDIPAGSSVGILGKTGAGKTTLVDLLLHIYNIEPGTLFIDGVDLMNIDLHTLRESIGYVPQDNFLFSSKIVDNICFGLDSPDLEQATTFAKYAAVDDNIQEFPLKYDTILGERGVTLSGGQRQRISIARAMIKNPPILILDDSVSAVDTETEEHILKSLHEIRKNKTTIVIAHRISTVKDLDFIIIIEDGKIIAKGSHQELLQTSKTYQDMVLLQQLDEEKEVK
ncbi:MAG: ABC transporter ATP-binding protein [Bacilli bacterium]|nr:ABC transporter ATP-binding protein [Bacilli bacterium]